MHKELARCIMCELMKRGFVCHYAYESIDTFGACTIAIYKPFALGRLSYAYNRDHLDFYDKCDNKTTFMLSNFFIDNLVSILDEVYEH